MADAFIEAGTTGKKLQTYENTVDGQLVHSEAVTPTDQDGVPFTAANALPVRTMNALVTVAHDEVALSDFTTDDQPQTVTFKLATVTVATVTLTYSGGAAGGNLTGAVRT